MRILQLAVSVFSARRAQRHVGADLRAAFYQITFDIAEICDRELLSGWNISLGSNAKPDPEFVSDLVLPMDQV